MAGYIGTDANPDDGSLAAMAGTLPAAVLWDMDGTLVDTEPYWISGEYQLVAAHGNGNWNDQHAHHLIGFDLLDSAAYIREHGQVDMEPLAIVEYLLASVIEQLAEKIPWRPGAQELLAALVTSGVPCGLVTMSWRPLVEPILQQLPGMFAVSVTGEELPHGHGKPHPAPYLKGAELLGFDPSACVAIEDSHTGMRSALAAGCVVVGVPNKFVSVPTDEPALHIFETLERLTPADLAALTH